MASRGTLSVKAAPRRLSPAAKHAVSEAKAGRGSKLAPAVKEELRGSPAPTVQPASSGPIGMPNISWPSMPGLGMSAGEKALFVVLLIVIGAGIYSRVYNTSMFWGLGGFNSGRPSGAGMAAGTPANLPTSYYAQQNRRLAVASDTMATRMAMANPARTA